MAGKKKVQIKDMAGKDLSKKESKKVKGGIACGWRTRKLSAQ